MRAFLQHFPWWLLPVLGQIGGDPFGGGGGGLGGIFGDINSALAAIVDWVWTVLTALGSYLLALVNYVWDFLKGIVRTVGAFFHHVWEQIVKNVLVKVLQVYAKVRAWLSNLLSPLLRILKQIRAWYDWFFKQYVRPVLVIIQKLRGFLQVFRLLGFKWAARLDARLADIENKIVKAYEILRQNLNQVTSWLQLVIDPTFLLRRNPLFGAIIRSAPELRNLMLQTVTRPLTPDETDAQTAAQARYTLNSQNERQKQYYSQGQLPPDLAASQSDFEAKFSAYINQ